MIKIVFCKYYANENCRFVEFCCLLGCGRNDLQNDCTLVEVILIIQTEIKNQKLDP